MANIEWHNTREFEPEKRSLVDFCQENGIPMRHTPHPDQLLVFVNSGALGALHHFLSEDLIREHGGVLVGKPFVDVETDCTFVVINSALPGLDTEGSSIHMQFTPAAWSYILGIIEEDYPDEIIVGWYHSHPGLGVFMSSTDRATQEAFYNHEWNIAVVFDPVAKKTGWFGGASCQPLYEGQVITYRYPQGKEEFSKSEIDEITLTEKEFWERQQYPLWRWLLPFAMLLTGLLGLTWWLGQRMKTLRKG
jgi:proteasome lid subunit RPN8/RPN11